MTTEALIQRAIDEYAAITGAPDGRTAKVPTLARYISLKLAEHPADCYCKGTGIIGAESNPGRRFCPGQAGGTADG